MRFMLVWDNGHHHLALKGLGEALSDLGHDVMIAKAPAPLEVASHFDVLLVINAGRDEITPKNVVCISWLQDYIWGNEPNYDDLCLSRDLVYTFGDPVAMGTPCQGWKHYRGSLLTGANPELLGWPLAEPEIDLNIAGYIPEPICIWPTWARPSTFDGTEDNPILMDSMQEVMQDFKPLTGNLDPPTVIAKLNKLLEERIGSVWSNLCEHLSGEIVHCTARAMDRQAMARAILSVSHNVEFCGFNWSLWPEFVKWTKPFLHERADLYNFYQRSKINTHNNIKGFGLHHRVIEAMALGAFVMFHATPAAGVAGRLTETFEPDVHFGEFTPENFKERARYWLDNKEARLKAAVEARKIIKAKHLWDHRARQLLSDLA